MSTHIITHFQCRRTLDVEWHFHDRNIYRTTKSMERRATDAFPSRSEQRNKTIKTIICRKKAGPTSLFTHMAEPVHSHSWGAFLTKRSPIHSYGHFVLYRVTQAHTGRRHTHISVMSICLEFRTTSKHSRTRRLYFDMVCHHFVHSKTIRTIGWNI